MIVSLTRRFDKGRHYFITAGQGFARPGINPADMIVTVARRLLANVAYKGFFHLLSANFIIGFLGFGSQLLVAKFLTPTELGEVRIIQSYVAVAAIIAGFGFNTAVLKLCSESRSLEEKSYIFARNIYYTIPFMAGTLCLVFILARHGLLSADPVVNRWMEVYMLAIPGIVGTSLTWYICRR